MADIKRTLTKRDAQVKIIHEYIKKGNAILDAEENVRAIRDLEVLTKNIKSKKDYIDRLNEEIINVSEENEIEKEIQLSSELDLLVDTEISRWEVEVERRSVKTEETEENIKVVEVADKVSRMNVHFDSDTPPRKTKQGVIR